jgi:regulator of RNase E activity RraA
LVSDISRLSRFTTPTIANALEILGEDPTVGFTDGTIRPLSAEGSIFVGRARTATVATAAPRRDAEASVETEDYWRYIARHAGPTIVVVQDVDPEPVGAMWGEVQARLHKALGVTGVVTNGAIRDLTELTRLGFPTLGSRASVSHAHPRYVEIDMPVVVGGVDIRPGDLVHADRHGLQRIPARVDVDELARIAADLEAREQELFAAAEEGDGIEAFLSTFADVQARWPSVEGAPAASSKAIS